jgi:HK97 family phage prohead protease
VVGIAVPFDAETVIAEAGRTYTEVFRRGAFARTITERGPHRVKFLSLHDRNALPIGRAESLVEEARGLVGSFRVSKTVAGDEVLELIRDGALDALSVGFRPIRDRWNADRSMVERIEAALPEVSTVAFPAYESALISGVRAEEYQHLEEDAGPDAAIDGTSGDHLDLDAAASRRRTTVLLDIDSLMKERFNR